MEPQDRIEALEMEVERLRKRVVDLETIAFGAFVAPIEWGLTATETRILATLMRRPLAPKEALMAAVTNGRDECASLENATESHISKLRRKLERYGGSIASQRFSGYRLDDHTRQFLAERLAS